MKPESSPGCTITFRVMEPPYARLYHTQDAGRRSLSAEEHGEEAFLEVEAVLGFLEDQRFRAVDDFVGDFHAAVGGEAVHDDGVFGGGAQEGGVDLVRPENGQTLALFRF